MEIKEIINVIKTEFKKSKLSSILNKGESYLIEDYVQFIATCPMALPFAENYKFANKEFNKEYYDLFDSVEAWKNLKGKGYKKFLQVADDDIIVDEKITFGIDVCVTDNSINYYILTHEFEDPFFKEYPLYFGNEKELKFILGTVFDNLSLMESKTSARNSIKESKDITIEEFISNYKNNDCFSIRDKENGHESECFWGSKKDVLDSDYRLFTVLDTDVNKETDDTILYIDLEENAWVESKKSARKSIKEGRIDKGAVVYEFGCMLNRLGYLCYDYSNESNNEKCDEIIYMIMDLLKTMPKA